MRATEMNASGSTNRLLPNSNPQRESGTSVGQTEMHMVEAPRFLPPMCSTLPILLVIVFYSPEPPSCMHPTMRSSWSHLRCEECKRRVRISIPTLREHVSNTMREVCSEGRNFRNSCHLDGSVSRLHSARRPNGGHSYIRCFRVGYAFLWVSVLRVCKPRPAEPNQPTLELNRRKRRHAYKHHCGETSLECPHRSCDYKTRAVLRLLTTICV